MRFIEELTGQPLRFWLIVAFGSLIGLAAAWGREQHEEKSATRKWLVNRLLLMPFLALSAAALSEQFGWSRIVTAFAAGLLSLLGYEALRVLTTRTLAAGEARIAELIGPSGAATVQAGDEGVVVVATPAATPAEATGAALRRAFQSAVQAPDEGMMEQLRRLGAGKEDDDDAQGSVRSDPAVRRRLPEPGNDRAGQRSR